MSFADLLQRQRVFNAPMCGISDYPFRSICRAMGAGVTFTEMVAAEAVVRGDKGRMRRLDYEPGEPGPAMQLYGSDPGLLGEAAARLEGMGAALVDLNMGCPVRNVVSSRAGAALLRDLPRVAQIFRSMRAAVTIPLTAKMRWDWGDAAGGESPGSALEVARIAQEEGVEAVCLHPRTRAQGYTGLACWEQIAKLKGAVRIPVIGNGDIRAPADALAMTRATGCDAVMIGRALIGDPWLLRDTIEALARGEAAAGERNILWEARCAKIVEHARLIEARQGARAFSLYRKHAIGYLRGVPGVRAIRDRLMLAGSIGEIEAILAAGPDPDDPTIITINTDEHDARERNRRRAAAQSAACAEEY
jgi:nifR3 family TIM-barrel protein